MTGESGGRRGLARPRVHGFVVLMALMAGCRREPAAPAGEEAAGGTPGLEASASERRLAVVVGSNVGSGARAPLRFAETDAAKVAKLLVEIGGVAAEDVRLLRGSPLGELRRALAWAAAAVRATKDHQKRSRTLLLFYYSGHSDGTALELGRERLEFAELRKTLGATGADVRLAVLDACRSGGAIGVKGGKPGKGFDVAVMGLPALVGEVFLTASRADEVALESAEIAGSFFTHHLLSALRGAADADRNGLVTLEEVYRHTARATVSAAAGTLFGGQTPAYDYQLIGHGDLVLSQLRGYARKIYLPGGFDRVLVMDRATGLAVAEAGLGTGMYLALPVGRYRLRGQRNGLWYSATTEVRESWQVARNADFLAETVGPPAELPPLADITRDFRPGEAFPSALPRSHPYFCEPTTGQWKGCRTSGCSVCAEMLLGFPNYLRNHPNCLPIMDCEGRYFECSANCPVPSEQDSCDPLPDGWVGCVGGCAVASLEIARYPRYFDNHPNCIPYPGRQQALGRCGAACPAPTDRDR